MGYTGYGINILGGNKKMYKCKLCNEIFNAKGAMINHMFSIHRIQHTQVKSKWDEIVEEIEGIKTEVKMMPISKEVKKVKEVNTGIKTEVKMMPIKDGVGKTIKDTIVESKEEDYSIKAKEELEDGKI